MDLLHVSVGMSGNAMRLLLDEDMHMSVLLIISHLICPLSFFFVPYS